MSTMNLTPKQTKPLRLTLLDVQVLYQTLIQSKAIANFRGFDKERREYVEDKLARWMESQGVSLEVVP